MDLREATTSGKHPAVLMFLCVARTFNKDVSIGSGRLGPGPVATCDPRLHGCTHPVVEGSDFIELARRSDEWCNGPPEPFVFAPLKRQPLQFKAFRSELDVPLGCEILDGQAEVWATWEAFSRRIGPSRRSRTLSTCPSVELSAGARGVARWRGQNRPRP